MPDDAVIAEVPGIGRLEFPAGTDKDVVARTVRRVVDSKRNVGGLSREEFQDSRGRQATSGNLFGANAQEPWSRARDAATLQRWNAEKESDPLFLLGTSIARGGKVLAAVAADAANSLVDRKVELENIGAYARDPASELPVEQTINDLRGWQRYASKAALGALKTAPAIGVSYGLGALGAPAPVASGAPFVM